MLDYINFSAKTNASMIFNLAFEENMQLTMLLLILVEIITNFLKPNNMLQTTKIASSRGNVLRLYITVYGDLHY